MTYKLTTTADELLAMLTDAGTHNPHHIPEFHGWLFWDVTDDVLEVAFKDEDTDESTMCRFTLVEATIETTHGRKGS